MAAANEHHRMPHGTAASDRSETEEPMGETFSLASAGPVVEEWVEESVSVEVTDIAERDVSGEDLPVELRLPTFPVPWRHPIRATVWTVRSLFGLLSLLLLLAIVAAIPIVNFVALGYLLEVVLDTGGFVLRYLFGAFQAA